MTIGSLLVTACGAILKLPVAVDVAGLELGTLGVILLILVLIGGLFLASGPSGSYFSASGRASPGLSLDLRACGPGSS